MKIKILVCPLISSQTIPNYVKQYACIYLNFWLWFYICLSPHLIAIQVPTALPLKPSNTSAVFISKSPVLYIPPRTRTAPLVWFIPIWVTTILQVHKWSSPMKCMQVLVAVLLCVVFMVYHIFTHAECHEFMEKQMASFWIAELRTASTRLQAQAFLNLSIWLDSRSTVPNQCECAHGLYITI